MSLIFWRTFAVRQLSPFCTVLVALCFAYDPATAQDRQTTYLDVTPSEQSQAYRDATQRSRLQNDLLYIDETEEDLLADVARPTEARPERDSQIYLPSGTSGPGVFIVVALFAILLFLILKFGAGGTLLRSDPKNVKKAEKPHDNWALRPEDIPEGDLLSRIKNMKDRREALILLLRYSLIRAAEVTDTNFRRADTEREALGRLPNQWPMLGKLRRLLMQTELVHYGGREIDDDAYQAALNDGADILRGGGGNGR